MTGLTRSDVLTGALLAILGWLCLNAYFVRGELVQVRENRKDIKRLQEFALCVYKSETNEEKEACL